MLLVVRRTRTSSATATRSPWSASACCCCRWSRAWGAPINGSRIWVSLGPIGFQPGEFAKIALAIFFASYLVEKRELLAMRSFRLGPLSLPDPKHLGPVLVAWGLSIVVMVAERTSARRCCSSPCSW